MQSGTGVQAGDLEAEDEFDYVKYAEQKAMLFYWDMVTLGLVTEDELKEWSGNSEVIGRLKKLP